MAAGVQASEDAPFVTTDYRFLPGDYLYFTFEVSGFTIKSDDEDETRRISLAYQITPEDAKRVPLTPPNSGAIQTELNPEDRHWTPKRRASFLLPAFVGAGEFHVHVTVKDLFANTETSKDIPFSIGGLKVEPTGALTVQNFRFYRNQKDTNALDVAAYSPGDTIYARFDMVGCKIGQQNTYHVAYSVTVLRPDGKTFFEDPNAADLQSTSFYPVQFVPGTLMLKSSPDTSRGQYIIVLTVRDLIGNQSYQTKQPVSIE